MPLTIALVIMTPTPPSLCKIPERTRFYTAVSLASEVGEAVAGRCLFTRGRRFELTNSQSQRQERSAAVRTDSPMAGLRRNTLVGQTLH